MSLYFDLPYPPAHFLQLPSNPLLISSHSSSDSLSVLLPPVVHSSVNTNDASFDTTLAAIDVVNDADDNDNHSSYEVIDNGDAHRKGIHSKKKQQQDSKQHSIPSKYMILVLL